MEENIYFNIMNNKNNCPIIKDQNGFCTTHHTSMTLLESTYKLTQLKKFTNTI